MPIPDADDKEKMIRTFTRVAFVAEGASGHSHRGELGEALEAVYDWAEANLPSYLSALPEPFKSRSTAGEKALMLMLEAARRAGKLDRLNRMG